MTLGFAFHIFLHGAVPVAAAWLFFRPRFKQAAYVMLATNLVDLDHLLSDPILDPDRCSIGNHLLHQHWAIGVYVVLAIVPKTRLIGSGLVIHMALDYIDCFR